MEKVISVVIPAYNSQDYIAECLDSFLTDKIMNDIEILVVNDGSTDNTAAIAQKYCERYPDTFRLFNKKNGGHGSGINYGIRYATGTFFKVVDSDDKIDTSYWPEYIELLKKLSGQNVDIVASDFITFDDKTGKQIKHWPATYQEAQYRGCVSLRDGEVEECIKMHHMTIRTRILQEHHIVIDENHFYVDAEYITYPIPYADRVYFDPHILYHYRLGRTGQTMRPEVMIRNKERHRYVMEQLLRFYDDCKERQEQLGITEGQMEYIARCIGQMVESHFQIYLSMGFHKGLRKQLKDWDTSLKVQYPQVYAATRKKSIDMLRKTNYIILPIGAIVYRIVKG